MEKAQKIGGAIYRVSELRAKKIMESTDAAEVRGLEQFISTALTEHAQELLGCWIAVETEYEPLVGAFAALLRRSGEVNRRVIAARQEQIATTEETK